MEEKINFSDWEKLELRVGEIIEVEEIIWKIVAMLR